MSTGARTAAVEGWRAFVRSNPALTVAAALLAVVAVLLVFGPLLVGDPYAIEPFQRLKPPSAQHWLGTDNYGRDVWARLLFGGRSSLLLAAAVTCATLALGLAIAMACGFSRIADSIVMRIMDAWMAFPAIVLALALAIAFGASVVTEGIALTVTFTPSAARILRSRVLVLVSRDFVAAARASGMGSLKTMRVHLVPHTLPLVAVQAVILMALAMLVDGGLSFLGLGIAPPTPTWGNMIAEGRAYMPVAPLLVIAPGLAIVVCVALFHALGNALRPLLDPEVRLLLQLQRLRAERPMQRPGALRRRFDHDPARHPGPDGSPELGRR